MQACDGVQTAAEAFWGIFRKTCDQIHVDGLEASAACLLIGAQHIRCLMGAAAGTQHGIFHGLGIDAHAVGTVLKNGAQLFFIQSVGTATLDREFQTPGQVKGHPDGVQKLRHLPGGQSGGRTPADIDAPYLTAGFPHQAAGDFNLTVQCL